MTPATPQPDVASGAQSPPDGLRAVARLTVEAFVRGDDLDPRQRDGGAQVRLLGCSCCW